MEVEVGKWYSTTNGRKCIIVSIESQIEPVQAMCWFDGVNSLMPLSLSQLLPISSSYSSEKVEARLSLVAAASKLYELVNAESTNQEKLIAPIESSIEPLPHQLEILDTVMSGRAMRYMLADEVGLGKTIEAGLIIDELLLRNQIKRILIVVPKGLAMQWQLEMHNHFNLDFKFIQGSDISSLSEIYSADGGLWKQFDRVIVSQDSIKPITSRKGWDSERVRKYNEERLDNMLSSSWDLIVIDEAHRLGGSTSSVARYKLGKQLSSASSRILLLTATPHQGKSDSFFRLLNILDDKAFPSEESVDPELVKRYVMRTEKRTAKDAKGNLLFQPRLTVLKAIPIGSEYTNHQKLYEAVTEYARHGYNQAVLNKKPHIGFLMVLLQRLLSSSTNAIHTTLERRLAVLEQMRNDESPDLLNALNVDEDLDELSSEEQQNRLIFTASGVLDEISEVKELLNLASICINTRDDAKAIALEDLITEIRAKEKKAKILVFTEFVPTQKMLSDFLEKRNYSITRINGSMSITERQQAQKDFADFADILISTDAGGEGLNLQFCHIIINYDLPWNPMKLEQRIGRVDRIGQTYPVTAYNFIIADSVEYRVREVLENKLKVIALEFGVDKTSDVLESDESAKAYVDAFTSSVMNPDIMETESVKAIETIKSEMRAERQFRKIFSASSIVSSPEMANSIHNHPFRYWTEQLVRNYLELNGGSMKETKTGYTITWSDKSRSTNVTFDNNSKDVTYLNLSDSKIHAIYTEAVKPFVKGETVPIVEMEHMPKGLSGNWGLFLYSISNEHSASSSYINIPSKAIRLIPVFLADNGSVYNTTAEKLWMELISEKPNCKGTCKNSDEVFSSLYAKAASRANSITEEVVSTWEITISEELSRLQNFYVFHECKSEKTGLDEVRRHRQLQLALYNSQIDEEIQRIRTIHPELACISMLRLEAM